MIHSITKSKISNKYAFVLKTGQLENMVVNNDIDIHIDLDYWLPQIIGSVLEAYFWLPKGNTQYNRLYIRAGALAKENVSIAREMMTSTILPEFILKTKEILALPDNSPLLASKRYFEAVFNKNEIFINYKK